jgi:calcineurin-like phosphoesterase family protein
MKVYVLHFKKTDRFGVEGTREIYHTHFSKWLLHLDYHKQKENTKNHSFRVEEKEVKQPTK